MGTALLLLFLQLHASTVLATDASQLLVWGDTWLASKSESATKLAVLSSELPSHGLNIEPDFPFAAEPVDAPKRLFLRLWCNLNASESDFLDVNFEDLKANESETMFCSAAAIAFKIQSLRSSNMISLRLVKLSERSRGSSAPVRTFHDFLTLQMVWKRIDGGTQMESGRLYVWTMDAWLSIHSLGDGAVERLNSTLGHGNDTLQRVKILNQTLINLMKSAPSFLQPLINVGLAFSLGHCENLQVSRSLLIASNYYTKLDDWNLELMQNSRLDAETGELYFYSEKLVQSISERMSARKIKFCIVLSLSGKREPYDVRQRPENALINVLNIYVNESSIRKASRHIQCELGQATRNVTLLSGIVTSHLVCPIVCNQTMSGGFDFFYKNSLLSNNSNNQTKSWINLPNKVKIAPGGHVLELPRWLSPRHHGGNYMCKAGDVTAHLHVRVVVPQKWLRHPPDSIYVVESDTLSLICEIEPMDSPNRKLSIKAEVKASSKESLHVAAPTPVIENDLNISVILITKVVFVCAVEPVAQVSILPQFFQLRSYSRIVVVRKLQPANHVIIKSVSTCSWKHLCLIPRRILLEFLLEPELLRSLASNGVRVSAHITLNGLPLLHEVLQERGWKEALSIEYDQVVGQVIFGVSIAAVKNKPELLKIFTERFYQNEATFNLVFNYHYKNRIREDRSSAVKYAGKMSYNGSDTICRDDETCFYSTEFGKQPSPVLFGSATADSSRNLIIDTTPITEGLSFASFLRRLSLLLSVAVLACAAVVAFSVFVRRRIAQQSEQVVVPASLWIGPENYNHTEDVYHTVLCVDKFGRSSGIMMDTL